MNSILPVECTNSKYSPIIPTQSVNSADVKVAILGLQISYLNHASICKFWVVNVPWRSVQHHFQPADSDPYIDVNTSLIGTGEDEVSGY